MKKVERMERKRKNMEEKECKKQIRNKIRKNENIENK
jgi:hypothetical protein